VTQARIQIDSVTGSNPPNGTALVLGATVAITNVNNGGEVTYLWEWLDRPENSAAAFANPAVQTTSFVADVEGTYVIRLTVNAALSDERTDIVIAAVSQLLTVERIPGAFETTQANTLRGWAEAINRWLVRVDRHVADNGTRVGLIASGANRGQVVLAEAADLIRTGLPEEVMCQGYGVALASNLAHVQAPLFVVEGKPDGGTVVGAGGLGIVRAGGLFGPLSGAPTVGDPVYVDDGALLSLTPGTYTRQMGVVVWEDGTDYYIAVDSTAWRVAVSSAAVLVDAATAPVAFPSAVPIQAIPNTGLEFISSTSTTDSHTVLKVTPNDPINSVDVTGNGSVRLGENGSLLGPAGNHLLITSAAGRHIYLNPDANLALGWRISHTTGALTAQAVGGQLISNVQTPVAASDAATKAYVDLIGETLRFGNSEIVGAGATSYLDPCWERAISRNHEHPQVSMHAGKLTKMSIIARVAGTGDAVDFTIMLNGVATLAALTFPAATTSASLSISPVIPIVAGDLIGLRSKAGATTVSPLDIVVGISVVR
jgi:hypothetical protein